MQDLPSIPLDAVSATDFEASFTSQSSQPKPLQRPRTTPSLFTPQDYQFLLSSRSSTVVMNDPYQEDFYFIHSKPVPKPTPQSVYKPSKPSTPIQYVNLPPKTLGCVPLAGNKARPTVNVPNITSEKVSLRTWSGTVILIEKIHDYLIELQDLIELDMVDKRNKVITNIAKQLKLPLIKVKNGQDFLIDSSVIKLLLQNVKGRSLLNQILQSNLIDYDLIMLVAGTIIHSYLIDSITDFDYKLVDNLCELLSNQDHFTNLMKQILLQQLLNLPFSKISSLLGTFFSFFHHLLVPCPNNELLIKFVTYLVSNDPENYTDSQWSLLSILISEYPFLKENCSHLVFAAEFVDLPNAKVFSSIYT
ncbi:hypothetical protein P9112_000118 [Eukaryota sp. TZLM1-RC]